MLSKMKKVLSFVCLAIFLASCNLNIDSPDKPKDVDPTAVGFNVYVNRGLQTKAGWGGVLTLDELKDGTKANGFGVFAYYGNGALYNETMIPDFMYDQQVKFRTDYNVWDYTPIKYWPNEFGEAASSEAADRLTFFAYAPYVDVIPSTGVVTGDATTGIIGMSRNISKGDPVVMYSSSLTPGNSVDLCWGVAAELFTSSVDGDNNNVAAGYPFINVIKPKTGDHLKFEFNHALAQLNMQIDADINNEVSGDGKTKIYVRSVTFNGFSMRGSLNLNSNKTDGPIWYDISGTGRLKREPVTVYDGRTDGMEGVTTAVDVSEKPADLNPDIIQSLPYGDAGLTPGVTTTAVNLFNNTEAEAPVMVIPTPGVPMSVTIVYDVETEDGRLAGYLSDGVTHGSSVENKITKTITTDQGNMILSAGKKYVVKLHLGLTSVKFDAAVAVWDNTSYEGTAYLPENTTSLGTVAITYGTSSEPLTSLTMWKDESMTTAPTVSVIDEQSQPVSGFSVEWTSSNTNVATVAADGTVTPVTPGSATITAKATKDGKVASKSYTMYVNELTSISITSAATNIAVGGTLPVKATLVINGGNAINGDAIPSVTWESSVSDKISVTSPINAVKEGNVYVATTTATAESPAVLGDQAVITASMRGLSDNVTLTCTDSRTVTGVTLGTSKTTVWRYDGYTVPSVTVQGSESSDLTSLAEITWELDNSPVTVTGGIISLSAVGEHTVKVTASYNNTSATASVTVYANEVTGISISPSPAFVAPARTLSLTANLAKTNYGEISSLSVPATAIGWASQQTSYVTVSPDTGASTVATGVALGESQVTATVDSNYMQSGASNTATCTVTCTNSTSGTGTGFTGWN